MKHVFYGNYPDAPTIVLLHGTGGDEHSLLPLVAHLQERVNVLSVRGEVNENGALRFFARRAEGVYDLESLDAEMIKLKQFIVAASEQYHFALEKVILLGFSNGANIGLHLMLSEEHHFNRAVLLAPLYPLAVTTDRDLSHKSVFVSMGTNDPLCAMADNQALLQLFSAFGIATTQHWEYGHQVTAATVQAFTAWLADGRMS